MKILELTLLWWNDLDAEQRREYMEEYETGPYVSHLEKINIYTQSVIMIWWENKNHTLGRNVLGDLPRFISTEEITRIYLRSYKNL